MSVFPVLEPHVLHARLSSRDELALLDVREAGRFAEKHLLLAVCAPLWRLESVMAQLVPRRSTPIVLTDLDGSLLRAAAERLHRLGYGSVALLAGGTLAWEAAGLAVFSGDNVPSKALGEVIEAQLHTPSIDVATLRDLMSRGEPLVIVDGRTPEEFRQFSLPGAHNLPNAELPYRIRPLLPSPDTLVVVNCAGRTRSIVGAQTLIDAGLPNRVVSLEDGTMAWLLAGHALDHGCDTAQPEPQPEHLDAARQQALALTRHAGVPVIDTGTLAAFEADDTRTLYRFDIRSAEEYRAGHVPGWRWAPGGQLVQATDEYIGTRGARVVLADWDGVRAHGTAAWLVRLGGYEVFLYQPSGHEPLERGDEPLRVLRDHDRSAAPWVSAPEVHALLNQGRAQVFDVEHSGRYTLRHIAGARFAAPPSLPSIVGDGPDDVEVILTSSDGVLAQQVAGALRQRDIPARALLGGNRAWFEAGLPEGAGRAGILTGQDDVSFNAYLADEPALRNALFEAYLQWERDLVAQLSHPGGEAPFRVLPG